MNNVKKLEIKKLIKELDYIESDFNYKNEIVHVADYDFTTSVNNFLKKNKSLKKIFDDRISSKIDNFIINRQEDTQDNIENKVEVDNIDDKYKLRIKKLYREIVKLTHPDVSSNLKLNDIYIKSTGFYNNNDIINIYLVCDNLGIVYNIDDDDYELIINKINLLKNRISFLEKTISWCWYHTNDKKEKDKLILEYIKEKIS